jgi:predicted nucleic acid-binding protein
MGQRYLIDSNTIIDYTSSRIPLEALKQLDIYFNEELNVSIISKIEVLGFNAPENELKLITQFLGLANIFYVDDAIATKTIELRKKKKIKIGDAIIAATAIVLNLTLITRNIADFKNIENLRFLNPYDIG